MYAGIIGKCVNCVYDSAHSNLCDTCDPTCETDFSHFKADDIVSSCENCTKLQAKADLYDKVMKILKKYGQHWPSCLILQTAPRIIGHCKRNVKCDCGFEIALAKAKKLERTE